MEEPRQQQPVPPAPPQPVPSAPGYPQNTPYASNPQVAAYAGATQAAPSAVEVGGRMTRLLLRRAVWAGDQGWRVIRPRLGWLMLTAFLVGVIGFLTLLLIIPRFVRSQSTADNRVALIQPAPAVIDFLHGQQTYDADLMWASFSPELQASLERESRTKDWLVEQVENERRAGQRYRAFKYVGGVELANNEAMYFYVVEISSPQRNGNVSFVFTVGGDGKIVRVE